jgi:hypothetical protein
MAPTPISLPVSPPGECNVYASYDPFFVRNTQPQHLLCLLNDDMALLDLQGTPWALTLYVDYVYLIPIDRPGDTLNTSYTLSNPMSQQGLYRRADVCNYLMGVPTIN